MRHRAHNSGVIRAAKPQHNSCTANVLVPAYTAISKQRYPAEESRSTPAKVYASVTFSKNASSSLFSSLG